MENVFGDVRWNELFGCGMIEMRRAFSSREGYWTGPVRMSTGMAHPSKSTSQPKLKVSQKQCPGGKQPIMSSDLRIEILEVS